MVLILTSDQHSCIISTANEPDWKQVIEEAKISTAGCSPAHPSPSVYPPLVSSEIMEPKVVKIESAEGISIETMESKGLKRESLEEVSSEFMESKAVTREPVEDPFDIMNSKEHIEKFKKYEADFKQYLMAKYFSDKTIFGGNIFDVKMNIEGQTIMASRLPPYQSFLDPATFDELLNGKESVSSVESGSNGKFSIQGN